MAVRLVVREVTVRKYVRVLLAKAGARDRAAAASSA
jgi:DNA-binding NarL/FixJ family response regulator